MKQAMAPSGPGSFATDSIAGLASSYYGKSVHATKLVGELDLNYFLEDGEGRHYVLKIAHAGENLQQLALQNAMINCVGSSIDGPAVQQIIPSLQDEEIVSLQTGDGDPRYMRLLTWIEGKPLASYSPHSDSLLFEVGVFCGKLCRALRGFDHPGAHRFMKWDPSQADWIRPHLGTFSGEAGNTVEHFFRVYESIAKPLFPDLRKSVNYNDANDHNVLIGGNGDNAVISGVIDFGDAVYTHTINELAVAIAYAAMNKPDPLAAACKVVSGFHSVFPVTEKEVRALFPLIAARLLISVTCSARNRADEPDNEYLQVSDKPAWDLLKKMYGIHPSMAEAAFRNACGWMACPAWPAFRQWVQENHAKTIMPLASHQMGWLDLGIDSPALGNAKEWENPGSLNARIAAMVQAIPEEVALGRYGEARPIYTGSAFLQEGNDGPCRRTIHIGLDFFSAAGTAVRAVLDGRVHSFADNAANQDYGPTIVLEHKLSADLAFYTLYGHLGRASLSSLAAGQKVRAGDIIAVVGAPPENGNWTPHLHFQVILDMLGKTGDFPGVCTPEEWPIWQNLCPDPWLLLKGEPSPTANPMTDEEILDYRKIHLGKNLSISYRKPIRMVRGAGQFLVDNLGRKYLDTVNNVAHVGHEHPRVVAAGQRQMAVLNTNTRYLHENIIRCTRELLRTLPPSLNVAFFVNSGSEANELAMRLAKNYTGQKDMIVSELGYHGNTNACIDISSYKFDGPGGSGRPAHVHVIPIPDTYRGIYRAEDPGAGSKYATHVRDAVTRIRAEGRGPAALIFESVISCGGQVVLPGNFLAEAYALTRAAGGVCIADEVQTGCGRAGDHFWAFEQYGVVPDIVTIGKPIGNGHPLGVVVTTQALAEAFRNGMEYFNTFGGNPVSCAIGLEVLRVIREEGLQENAKLVGGYLRNGLLNLMKESAIIGDVRGPGLFIGFELVKDRITKEPATQQAAYFINRMRDKGILMSTDGPYNNVLKIKPPIVFSMSDADFLLESVRRVLSEDFMKIP